MRKVFLIFSCLLFIISLTDFIYSQQDSILKLLENNPYLIDSMNLQVKEIVISGNNITKNHIILREMSLRKGTKFTIKKYSDDIININKLGLFTRVEILPFPMGKKELLMNVDVNERFYILPLPTIGIDDGEWAKFWVGLNVRWDNFRGRNETVQLYARLFYNPGIRFSYFIPWIGDKLHLFTGISAEYSRTRNKSLTVVGKPNGGSTISTNDSNYDNINYRGNLTIGKQLFQYFRIYSDIGYNYLSTNPYAEGRTLSTTGTDKFLNLSIGIVYDSKNANNFATNGFYFRTSFTKYGFIDKTIDFGRYYFEGESYIPAHFSKNYFITIASKLTTSIATGPVIPYYNHEYLGYSEDYVRGWKNVAYEGENLFSLFNEIRIPIIQPNLIAAKRIAVVRDMPFIKTMYLRYGLYATIFYDIGTVWEKSESIKKKQFLSGTGVGLNLLLPFDYIVRLDWGFRLHKPIVGQLVLSLSAKF